MHTYVSYKRNGEAKVDGSAALKQSQVYPRGYAVALNKLWRKHKRELENGNATRGPLRKRGLDPAAANFNWSGAKLRRVVKFLQS